MKLLLIEDERQLSDALVALFKQNRYSVDVAYDGESGEEQALTGIYDVIILDIMLPKKNGLQILTSLREENISTPILLLTAKSEVEDKIKGLDYGADDYLTKPFVADELLARIRAISRRKEEFIGNELTFNETKLNKDTHELSYKGNTVKLGLKEFQILEMLMENSKQIIPKETFIEKIWGFDSDAEYNTVEVYISFIRKKLLAINSDMQIKATRGLGYSLEDLQ
ncbi:response regulator transcription factor [Anaerosphaera multitolerans]|uniref:DNA-binding response regulator n=1 Tax=Anaerosphaera multitolerans TaxID=2487351 RepID=A0A437S9D0_9FIRM|nr:response regulator transcription factor [Anaerosphaera multitolerans]RVU55719.1 DNA-binding response regulator [Anaerosphaera multitolerans]